MVDVSTGLPSNWSLRVSSKHNREYYYNESTKESVWDPPLDTDLNQLKTYLQQFEKNGFRPVVKDKKVRASHLLIKHNQSRRPKSWKNPEGISRTRDEAVILARKYRDQIILGSVTLGELAETESDCSSHAQSGDLGFFTRGKMQPPFEEAAFGLNMGEISDLVESDSGIHIIQRTA